MSPRAGDLDDMVTVITSTLGDRERPLFDITKPDGENSTRNLAQQDPECRAP
ncbi:MAG: hypothetical protein U0935_03940 [Pirellulales bacterium]